MKVGAGVSFSYLCGKQCMCLRSCSSLCTGWSHISLRCSWAGSDTWPPGGHWGSSSRRSDTVYRRARRGELCRGNSMMKPTFCIQHLTVKVPWWKPPRSSVKWKQWIRLLFYRSAICMCTSVHCICRLTEWWLGGGRSLHACAIVGHVVVRAGTHWSAGAEQTQPLTLLPVTWVSHWCRKRQDKQIRKTA